MEDVAVVIPTRNRPAKLRRCLESLGKARGHIGFTVYVCDSSDQPETRSQVEAVCADFAFAELHPHTGKNVAAARNACALVAKAALIVNVDDDIYVEPDAIDRLVAAYRNRPANAVVAGSVAWDKVWSRPVVMRSIGYGRSAGAGEQPDFLVGAFFTYSRKLALAYPWNDRVRSSDDRFMGAVWRSRGIHLAYEPTARAFHDHQHVSYGAEHQESHIYVNLFDALIANPRPLRAISYELLGFAASAKVFLRNRKTAAPFLKAWISGHTKLFRDWRWLKRYLAHVPPAPESSEDGSLVRIA